MFKKNLFTLSILIIYIVHINICTRIKPDAHINKIEAHYEQGKLRLQIFVPISPEEQKDFQNYDNMDHTDQSALNYKYYDDFQFRRGGNTTIDCEQYPKRIQIMIGQVNKRLSSLEYDNFDDVQRLEGTQDSYEFKFTQMNLRRHKYDFVAKCVGDNVYVHLMVKINKQRYKQQQSAILYLNNYVDQGIRYLQILRFAYPFDGTPFQEIYHQPLTYVDEEQNLKKLSFYQYDVKGKDIMSLESILEQEEVDISIPGFIFAHMYSEIQIMVSLQNDELKIYAVEHDDSVKDYIYLRYLLKIDQNSNKIQGEIFDQTNNQIVASCETDLKTIFQNQFIIEYRFLAGMFGKTQYQNFQANLNDDVIIDKHILMMENSWLDEDKEELKSCLIQQNSNDQGNQIELNWKMYEIKKRQKKQKIQNFVQSSEEEHNPSQTVNKISSQPIPQDDLTQTMKPRFSNMAQQKTKVGIKKIEVLSKEQISKMQDDLNSLYRDINKQKQKIKQSQQSQSNESSLEGSNKGQILSDKIKKQLINEQPRTSRNSKTQIKIDEKSNEEDQAQNVLNLKDQTKTFNQIPIQVYQLTKQLSLENNSQYNRDNYIEPFIRYEQNNKQLYIDVNFSQNENLISCKHQYTNPLEIINAFKNSQQLKVIINNIEIKGILNVFRINKQNNLIIQKNINLQIVNKFLQLRGNLYYCNFTVNKTKQLMLNIVEKKFKYQFYTRASKFQDIVNMEMYFINLTSGHLQYKICTKRLNQAQVKSNSKSIIHLDQHISYFSQSFQNVNIQNFMFYDFTSNLTHMNLTMNNFYALKDFNCNILYIEQTQQLNFSKFIYDKNNSFIFAQIIPFQNGFSIYRYDLNQQQGNVVLVTPKQLPIIEKTSKRQIVTYEKNATKFFDFTNQDFGMLFNIAAYQYQQQIPELVMLSLEAGRVFIGISSDPDQLLTLKIKQGENKNQINLELKKLIAPKISKFRKYNFELNPYNNLRLIRLFDQRQQIQQKLAGLTNSTQNTIIDCQFVLKKNQSQLETFLLSVKVLLNDNNIDIVLEGANLLI